MPKVPRTQHNILCSLEEADRISMDPVLERDNLRLQNAKSCQSGICPVADKCVAGFAQLVQGSRGVLPASTIRIQNGCLLQMGQARYFCCVMGVPFRASFVPAEPIYPCREVGTIDTGITTEWERLRGTLVPYELSYPCRKAALTYLTEGIGFILFDNKVLRSAWHLILRSRVVDNWEVQHLNGHYCHSWMMAGLVVVIRLGKGWKREESNWRTFSGTLILIPRLDDEVVGSLPANSPKHVASLSLVKNRCIATPEAGKRFQGFAEVPREGAELFHFVSTSSGQYLTANHVVSNFLTPRHTPLHRPLFEHLSIFNEGQLRTNVSTKSLTGSILNRDEYFHQDDERRSHLLASDEFCIRCRAAGRNLLLSSDPASSRILGVSGVIHHFAATCGGGGNDSGLIPEDILTFPGQA
ncbi:uncharacterized protein CLUP02_14841 [Colletotrichum lupini]|uniref:Uncharacterized protein n=1 Tax=Colletotrichum lupini TaxID=145971 RepID=A0A9Q8T6V6_9PEZI|nr:uncharacterized protein CLUP02_14841 [Colletotrichum lupini]UQC89312.1 hypothetical protein CLUP02_14841 [Colletotrichum lupini]